MITQKEANTKNSPVAPVHFILTLSILFFRFEANVTVNIMNAHQVNLAVGDNPVVRIKTPGEFVYF